MDVVIPTMNNIETKKYSLYYTVRSILAQSVQTRIFIVDNGNYKTTKYQLEKDFGGYVNVIDGTKKPKNISFARNLGAGMGHDDYLVFMDDDMIIGSNHSLEQIKSTLAKEDFYCGANRFWTDTNWATYLDMNMSINQIRHILKAKSFLPKAIERISGKQSFHQYSYIGNFGAIKRSVFNEIGGFDDGFEGWTYQDTDLMMRLCMKNYSYDLMSYNNMFVFHLSHGVDKSNDREKNRDRYHKKQKESGKKFHLNHFFGIYDDESFTLFSDF